MGVQLWCYECYSNPLALLLAVCNYQRESRLLAELNEKCRKCLALQSSSIDYSKCVNMACMVKQKRILLGRSKAELAVRSHSLTERGFSQQQ
ncbi:unnamed protein product [Gongylonema pulchrum]|uniref:Uncharacterized protein n=1 Tax=Gongylonema pulchrum TaxID=637853 RepID=A0A3P6SQB3_9BILA|nr:unnamed protein product [Gongylonema pulchrum]